MHVSPPPRASGVLLHPTSLPGRFGIGDVGPRAHEWIDMLADSGTRLWQILPLGPTGYADSPYQCFSSFAGNPYLVSPDALVDDGLITEEEVGGRPPFPDDRVEYGPVITWKLSLLDRAYDRFVTTRPVELIDDYHEWRQGAARWVEDFALFMALKDRHHGRPWTTWKRELRLREPAAIAVAHAEEHDVIERQVFRQFLFFRQWHRLREHAAQRGVSLIGDIPIFVAADSADVWANQALFRLDDEGRPTVVAGVPPDYFSETGQLWGNPLYDWDAHAAESYRWWIRRIAATLELVDVVRVDHFRAFADYWEIPAGSPTAETGQWLDGPGMAFFDAVTAALGELPIIAEDLGDLSPAVPRLLRRTGLPGMRILQFAFESDERDEFLPHTYPVDCVAYTGTHDNDTTLGWWNHASDYERSWAARYLGFDGTDPAGRLIRGVWQSRAMYALTTMQDLLRLGRAHRMNLPGTASGNWTWRMPRGALGDEGIIEELASLNATYDR